MCSENLVTFIINVCFNKTYDEFKNLKSLKSLSIHLLEALLAKAFLQLISEIHFQYFFFFFEQYKYRNLFNLNINYSKFGYSNYPKNRLSKWIYSSNNSNYILYLITIFKNFMKFVMCMKITSININISN